MSGYVTEQDVDVGLSFADGTQVGSPTLPGPVIPAGAYQVTIDDTSQVGDFDLQGPGVSFATPVETREEVTWTVAFEPCQTYSYRNDQQSTSTEWFQTSASSTSTAACAPAVTGSGETTVQASTTSTTGSAVTSGAAPGVKLSALGTPLVTTRARTRRTLEAVVNAAGRLTLTSAGKSFSRLAAGRYEIKTTDRSARANFTLEKLADAPITVSGTSFVGKRSFAVTLSRGRWTFFSSTDRARSLRSFTVSS